MPRRSKGSSKTKTKTTRRAKPFGKKSPRKSRTGTKQSQRKSNSSYYDSSGYNSYSSTADLLKQKQALIDRVNKLQQYIYEIEQELEREFNYQEQQREQPENTQFNVESDPIGDYRKFLLTLNIATKKDYFKWLLKNHPDKGGKDEELVKKVIEASKAVFEA